MNNDNDKDTIADVARKAGVSPSTISRVLNNRPGVGSALRERILSFIEEIGYKPNTLARSLITGSVNIIGLVFGDVRNPFYADLMFYIQRELNKNGYLVMAFNSEYNTEKEIDFISLARQFNFAGLILITAQAGDLHQKLRELDMPVVLVNRTFDDFVGNFVSIDNFQAGYLATKHLVELGHTRLGFVSGHFTSSSVQQRLNGFMQVVKNYNLKFDEKKHFFVGDLKLETGRMIAGQFVSQLEDMPSGVVICNDMMSIGFIDYCREMGVRIPEMLSVVGFDNIAISALHDISLTTVDQRVEEMCIRAAELILRRIENPSAPLERVMIDPTLVVRKTTAPFREDRLANHGAADTRL